MNFQLNGPAVRFVAVHEAPQFIAECAQAWEIVGREDFLLDDGEDDLIG